jgi:ABC-type lipoprotein export system ATPase subunit
MNKVNRDTMPNGNGHYRNGNERLIELRDVEKTYVNAAGSFTALQHVDLQVDRGEFVAVIGKSGSGKSTLINMITGIDRPTTGEVLVGDTAVHTLSEGKLASWRGRNVGIVFQFFQLLPTLSAVENVMLPMDFCNTYGRGERPARAMALLEQVGLLEEADKMPASLSGGEQQRVAIARALANDPPILIADEPTGNLDSKTAESVFQLFDHLVTQGKTILMVTHDRGLAQRATRTVIISDGQVIEEYLARTFPTLTESQLARATRDMERLYFSPGEVIIKEGTPPEHLFVVTNGQVEVHLRAANGEEFIVARMNKGQYVGEVELVRGGGSIATVRAALGTGAELAALHRSVFAELLAESAPTRAEIERVAQERLQENVASRQVNGTRTDKAG